VKYAYDLVLLAQVETQPQDTNDRQPEIGQCYGKERDAEKNKVIRISRQRSSIQIDRSKTTGKCEKFQLCG
jgi:3-phenylpropionate/cinnamic acid dioxygenase small subunit